MYRRPAALVLLSAACFMLGCALEGPPSQQTSAAPVPSSEWEDSSPHESAFVEVGGIRLNYLDWGGEGPALVLLTGLGFSPHIYDDLALAFVEQFRVVALARRGHGRSGGADASFDNDLLVEDIRGWLDALGLGRVILVGHSLAGNEITRFAALYPERVEKLIYLDAMYDYSNEAWGEVLASWPVDLTPTGEDLVSLDSFRSYLQRALWHDMRWTDALEAATRDMAELEPSGRVRMMYADSAVMNRWYASLKVYAREYSRVQAPALAIVALWYEGGIVPPDASDSLRAAARAWLTETARPWQRENTEQFLRETPSAEVLEVDEANHTVFVHHADTVVVAMKAFLAGR